MRVASYIEKRRASGGILSVRGAERPTDGSPRERVLVVWVTVLPIVPDLINHLYNGHISHHLDETVLRANRVVKEEHGIYVRIASVNQQTRIVNRNPVHHLGTTSVQGCKREAPTRTGTIRINPLLRCCVVQDEVLSGFQDTLGIEYIPP